MSISASNLKIADDANQIFDKMRKLCDDQVAKGAKVLDVVKIVNDAGLKVDAGVLSQLAIPAEFIPHPFVGWAEYFPWKPLWSYYWGLTFPGSFASRAFLPAVGTASAHSVVAGGSCAEAFSAFASVAAAASIGRACVPSVPMP